MSKLAERLKDASRSGVYRVTDPRAVEEVARSAGLRVVAIALEGGKQHWLAAFARALALPEWFGNNWDALEDALADLPSEGHVLLLHGAPAATGDDLGILLDVLDASAGFWKSHGKPFFALAVDPARALELPALYRES